MRVREMEPKVLETIRRETANTQVLVFAGGTAKRMGFIDKPKPLLEVGGKPLIDRCIEYLSYNGFKEFVILVGHKADQIMSHLGDGGKHGVEIRYSVDPPIKAVGKAKALRHAIETGAVDTSRRALIAFPDDIFLDQTLPTRFLLSHIEAAKTKGTIASAVLASAVDFPYGVAEVDPSGYIVEFQEKPTIQLFVSTGLYIFEPQVYQLVLEQTPMDAPQPIEFEKTILPQLAKQRKLHAHIIPKDVWQPINTLKQLEQADNTLKHSNPAGHTTAKH